MININRDWKIGICRLHTLELQRSSQVLSIVNSLMALKSQSIIWIVQINNSNLEKTQSLFIRYFTIVNENIFFPCASGILIFKNCIVMHLLYHSCFQISNEKKITSDFIILFLVYCLNSIYIFFFPQNSLRWWRPNSMAGLVCEWRGNSDVICIFVYRRLNICIETEHVIILFYFFSVLYICLKCSKLVRSVFCVHSDVAFVNNKVALTIVISCWLFYNY